MEHIILRCMDHPEANGREAQAGERKYTLKFPLESGTNLQLECGRETFDDFSDMIARMILDDAAESVEG